MDRWDQFFRMARWALDGLAWAWPVTAALIVGLVAAAVHARRRIYSTLRWQALRHLAPLIAPAAILALGTWFACENCPPVSVGPARRYMWAMWTADTLVGLQLIGAGWLVWRASPVRLLSAMFQLLLLWYSFWAAVMAGMSMSGNWL